MIATIVTEVGNGSPRTKVHTLSEDRVPNNC